VLAVSDDSGDRRSHFFKGFYGTFGAVFLDKSQPGSEENDDEDDDGIHRFTEYSGKDDCHKQNDYEQVLELFEEETPGRNLFGTEQLVGAVFSQAAYGLNCTQAGDSVLVTVTGRNLYPYQGAAMVVASNTPYVTHMRHAISDAPPGGNGDGIVNPGEAIKLPVWVKNWGNVNASGVIARMVWVPVSPRDSMPVMRPRLEPMLPVTDPLNSSGAITFPADLDIFFPSPSTTNPWVRTER
jgi:hypothetical protein